MPRRGRPDAARCWAGPRRLLGALRRHVQPRGPRVSGGGSALGGEESVPSSPFRSASAGSPGSIPEVKRKEQSSASCLPSQSRRRSSCGTPLDLGCISLESHPLSLPGLCHRPGRSHLPARSPRRGRIRGGGMSPGRRDEPRAAGGTPRSAGCARRPVPATPSGDLRGEARPSFSRCSP